MVQNFYEVLWVFLIYSFLGWCTEVTYAAVCEGTFVNRGFLNGPVCPIYGVGVLLVLGILWPLKENLLILFFGSVLVTTVLEYLVGWVLEKLFHDKWWDYSDLPFNIHGYVCLKFSLLWGMACVLIVRVIHPSVMAAIDYLPRLPGTIAAGVLMAVFAGDLIITVIAVQRLSIRLRVLEELDSALDRLSEGIGEGLSEHVLTLQEKADILGDRLEDYLDSSMEKAEDLRAELRERSRTLLEQQSYIHERIMKAYPQLKRNHRAIIARLEELRQERKKNRKGKK